MAEFFYQFSKSCVCYASRYVTRTTFGFVMPVR